MLVVGQWDQEDSYGAPAVYKALTPKDKNGDMVTLVIGPWRHSGVNHYGYELGALTFTGDTSDEFRVEVSEALLRSLPQGRTETRIRRGSSPTPPASTAGRNHRGGRWALLKPLYLADGHAASFSRSGCRRPR